MTRLDEDMIVESRVADKSFWGPIPKGGKGAMERKFSLRKLGPAQWILATVAFGIVALMIWAEFAQVSQLVRAQGQVIAVARTQVIQAASEGVLADLLVTEGQRVKKGQILARLDPKRAQAGYEDSFNKVGALRAAQVRLKAEVFGQPLVFTKDIPAEFVRNQTELYRRRRQALAEGIGALQKNLNYVRAELATIEPLLRGGDIGELEVVQRLKQEADLEGQIVNVRNRYFQDAQVEMTRVEEELANAEQVLAERSVLLTYTDLRAPTDGVVKQIAITTLGAAVRQGDVVMELLPTGGGLIFEAKVKPADFASIRVGQHASVKLDAFDSSIYGGLNGDVTYVSPDALTQNDPRLGTMIYYRVHVRLEDPAREKGNPRTREINVQPGMTGMAEIRTHDRTVMSFLTKPITKTLSDSMTER